MFSRLERFPQEKKRVPPVGAYDPKFPANRIGPVSFNRSPREKQFTHDGPSVGHYNPKYPDKTKFVVDMSKTKFGSVASLCTSGMKNIPVRKELKMKRRSKSVEYVNFDKNNDLVLPDSFYLNESKKERPTVEERDLEITILQENLSKCYIDAAQQTDDVTERSDCTVTRVERVTELRHELENVKEDGNNIRNDAELLRKEITEILPELNKQKSLIESLFTERNKIDFEFNALIGSHIELKNRIQEMFDELDQKNKEKCVVDEENVTLHERVSFLTSQLVEAKSASDDLKKSEEHLHRTFESREKELQQQIGVLNNEIQKKEEFWLEAKCGFDKILTEADENSQNLQLVNERLKDTLSTSLASLQRVKHQIRSLQLERESLMNFSKSNTREILGDFDRIVGVISTLSRSLDEIEKDKQRLVRENTDLLVLCEQYDRQRVSDREKFLSIEEERLRSAEEVNKFKTILFNLSNDFAAMEVESRRVETKEKKQEDLIARLNEENLRLQNDNDNLLKDASIVCRENDKVKAENRLLEDVINANREKSGRLAEEVEKIKNECSMLHERQVALIENYDKLKTERKGTEDDLRSENSSLKSNVVDLQKEVERLVLVIETNSVELERSRQESLDCRRELKELSETVAPFKEQLDLYQTERKVLSDRENQSDETLKALLEKYATLLSHHNQKQKIHHVNNLKDELLKLRQENRDLKKENAKVKCSLDSLQDKIFKLEGKKRFQPSEAFRSSDKENRLLTTVNQNF